jgi:hypothetical protein
MTDEELIRAVLLEHQQKRFESGDYWCAACGFTTMFGCLPYRAATVAVQAWEEGFEAARQFVTNGYLPENPYRKDNND